ncbi:hypothetical protein B0O99DRAFT_6769 [Bisporella sp. PMI_857]|nr:hypothetical protein B0O99DRAFT_6769 [Bisporella sp. PMI_857]
MMANGTSFGLEYCLVWIRTQTWPSWGQLHTLKTLALAHRDFLIQGKNNSEPNCNEEAGRGRGPWSWPMVVVMALYKINRGSICAGAPLVFTTRPKYQLSISKQSSGSLCTSFFGRPSFVYFHPPCAILLHRSFNCILRRPFVYRPVHRQHPLSNSSSQRDTLICRPLDIHHSFVTITSPSSSRFVDFVLFICTHSHCLCISSLLYPGAARPPTPRAHLVSACHTIHCICRSTSTSFASNLQLSSATAFS